MSLIATSFDERLARRILQGEGNEVQAAVTLFERHDPVTLEDAVGLLEAYGSVTPQAFEHAAEAWDIFWHLRDMPCD